MDLDGAAADEAAPASETKQSDKVIDKMPSEL